MQYLLDTNIWIAYLKDPTSQIRSRLAGMPISDIFSCSVVWAELLHGARKYELQQEREARIAATLLPFACLSFDFLAAHQYARIRDDLERRGTIIGGNDLMIAAIAMTHNLTVVTHNGDEFLRVTGLRVEDWQIA